MYENSHTHILSFHSLLCFWRAKKELLALGKVPPLDELVHFQKPIAILIQARKTRLHKQTSVCILVGANLREWMVYGLNLLKIGIEFVCTLFPLTDCSIFYVTFNCSSEMEEYPKNSTRRANPS